MSKKKYDWDAKKCKGCNKTRGLLLTEEQISSIRYYLFLNVIQFKLEAKRNLRNGEPKSRLLHEWRKYREVVALYTDLENLLPYVYVRA